VIPALQAEGHQVIAGQYALNTTADDVATVRSTLGRVSSPAEPFLHFQLRRDTQLIQVKDQTHLWAQDYDYQVKDILNVIASRSVPDRR